MQKILMGASIRNEEQVLIVYMYLDSKKARNMLRWTPRYSLLEGIKDMLKEYFLKEE